MKIDLSLLKGLQSFGMQKGLPPTVAKLLVFKDENQIATVEVLIDEQFREAMDTLANKIDFTGHP